MDDIREIYKRFKKNYRTESGGINLYPEFDKDLYMLIEWIEGELNMHFIPSVDCGWRPPYGEDD